MSSKYALERCENNIDFISGVVCGKYEIPVIKPEKWEETTFVPFNMAKGITERKNVGIHFFIDDFLFQRMWISKGKYLPMLQDFKAVMSPDFSMFTDWPVMIQMWNHYRKHLLAAWMQSNGVRVYPTICWSDEGSYEWCFDGEPQHATVCVSAIGTQKGKEPKRLFMAGYNKMLEVLEPETIIFYGTVPNECKGNIIKLEPYYKKLRGIRK